MKSLPVLLTILVLSLLAAPAPALGPQDVYLLVNKNVPDSQDIAEHYCKKRGVPADHIIPLDLPKGEDISRHDYNDKVQEPLRKLLKDKREHVKVLLSIYGVPLRVGPQQPSAAEKEELDKLAKEIEPIAKKVQQLNQDITKLEEQAKKEPQGQAAKDLPDRKKERDEQNRKIKALEDRRRFLNHAESEAAVDSELALLWYTGYNLYRWQINYRYFQVSDELREGKPPVIMTCRLDGPSVPLIKRIIDTSIEVEAKGLTGKVYVDARGIKYDPAKEEAGLGYGGYDESLREMARLLEKEGKLNVTLDDKPELFAPGSCPDCALYCGWYSLANYVPCCKFVPGAVAFHIASAEAVTLRDPNTKQWCKNLLDNGVVATLGPVGEPYTLGFPKPAEFFGFLATGEFTLVECYWRTELFASWMTVLVGDPLYNPYGKTPKLKSAQVKPSPVGAKLRFIKDK
jgi:uncharacterized protein (TIGR03790 family)